MSKANKIGSNRIIINCVFPTSASASSATTNDTIFQVEGVVFKDNNYGFALSLSGTNNVIMQTIANTDSVKILSGTLKNSEWYSLEILANIN